MSFGPEDEQERPAPTIRDRRRIDPETFEVRQPTATGSGEASSEDAAMAADPTLDSGEIPAAEQVPGSDGAEGADLDPRDVTIADLTDQVAERTGDLQRLQAEYVNYKRRVDRDRELARTLTIASVLNELLPVLDNIAAAREHDELSGGFKAVAESIEKVTTQHGLEAFGTVGDDFDPQIHEALMQLPDAGDGAPMCAQVFQVGYRVGERILRPARVAVGARAEDASAADASAEDASAADASAADASAAGVESPDADSGHE